jgi:hypothetical protein
MSRIRPRSICAEPSASRITLQRTPSRAFSQIAAATSSAISPRQYTYVCTLRVRSAERIVSRNAGKMRSPLISSSARLPMRIGAPVSASEARRKSSESTSSSVPIS